MTFVIAFATFLAFQPGMPVAKPTIPRIEEDKLANRKDCGDFLARLHRKPTHLSYRKCRYLADNQGKPLSAVYWVSGSHAASVEASLMKNTRLQRLRRSCCQWDSPGGQFIVNGQRYFVTMVSDENTVSQRRDWRKISRFAVIVETWTEGL